MKIRQFTTHFTAAVLGFTFLYIGTAADAPLKVSAKFDLSKSVSASSEGETFFELMSKEGGIKSKLDKDYETAFVITDAKTFLKKSKNFDHVERKIARSIKGGMKGLEKLMTILEGKKVRINQMYAVVFGALKDNDLFKDPASSFNSLTTGALVPIIAIASGKGVLVQLDEETYCYNYGYAIGAGNPRESDDPEAAKVQNDKDRKSGRSYGASASRNAYDPSDKDYLIDLANYTYGASNKELEQFYRTLFSILLKVDTSGIKKLSEEGQALIADFIAVYMAELDRHLMTGLTAYEWENALTEITMLGAYSATDEGKTLYGEAADNESGRELVESSGLEIKDRMVGFFGVGTQGTGLDGRNKARRHNLTKQIVKAEIKLNKKLVSRLSDLIGVKSGADVYDETMEFLNNYKTQDTVRENADELVDTLVEFVMDTRTNAEKISKIVK